MRVLQINAIYRFASTGRTCEEFQNYMNSNGDECITAYGERKGNYPKTIYVGNYIDHKAHAFFSRLFGKIGYYSSLPTLNLIRKIDKLKPDVIHVRTLHSNFVNFRILFKYIAKKDIPLVINLHDCFWFTGQCCHYTLNRCYKWKEKCGNCKYLGSWNAIWFFDRTRLMQQDKYDLFHAVRRICVIGVSEWVCSQARESFVFDGIRIECIRNWVDQSVFKPRKSFVKKNLCLEDKFIILCVASVFDNAKGLDEIKQLSEKIDDKCRIVLIGKVAEDLSNYPSIIHIDQTSNVDELVDYYNCADVFLQLSKEETGSKVMMEALSCGTPVVVYNSTCGPEHADNGCGLTVERFGDVDEILEKVMEVRTKGKDYYSKKCLAKSQLYFSKENNISKIKKVYESLIDGQNNKNG